MTVAREAILGRLKTALKRDARSTEAAERWLAAHNSGVIPARGSADTEDKLQRFLDEAGAVDASLSRIPTISDLPGAVTEYLAAHNLPTKLRVAPSLADAPWASQPMLELSGGTASGDDAVGLSRAFGGVAETGTLVFLSGPDNPTTVNFLPPTHIAVVAASDIAGNYEQVWARIRATTPQPQPGKSTLPRTVNWVTGPSRTADIEQTLLLGAHGPQRLHIIVIDNDA